MNIESYSKAEIIQLYIEQEIQYKEQIQQLQFELAQLKRAIFGHKTERFVSDAGDGQLDIFTKEQSVKEISPTIQVASHEKKKRQPKRKKLPEHLERNVVVLEPAVETQGMRQIGIKITEKLEVVPAKLYVHQIKRPTYVDAQGQIHIAEMPSVPFPKSIAGSSLAAKVAVDKYVDHLPLYRQSQIYARDQVELPRSTLNNIIAKGYHLLNPLYKKLVEKILEQDYLMADESSIRVLNKNSEKGSTKGCMLVIASPVSKMACMQYIKTKEKQNIYNALKNVQGHLQVDGNVTYEELAKLGVITLMHCMAHARRYFDKAKEYDEQRANIGLQYIQNLYRIERQIKELSTEEKYEKRQKLAVAILDEFKSWLEENLVMKEPKNPIQKAVRYTLKRWQGLIEYTNHGHLQIDNNLIERQIRPLALGRKNYLFAGAHSGANYAALYYSLFATCRLNGIEPFKWLSYVFDNIQDYPVNKIVDLLPTEKFTFR